MIEVEAAFLTPDWLKKTTAKLSTANLPYTTKFHRFSFVKNCFSGSDLVSWLMCNTKEVCSREAGVVMSQILLQCGIIEGLNRSFEDSSKLFFFLGKHPSFDVVCKPKPVKSDKEMEERIRPKLLDFSKVPKEIGNSVDTNSQLLEQGYVFTKYPPSGSFIISRLDIQKMENFEPPKKPNDLLLIENRSPMLFSTVVFPFIVSLHQDNCVQFFHIHGKWSRKFYPIGWNFEDAEGIFFRKNWNLLVVLFRDRIVTFKMPSKSIYSLNSLPYWTTQSAAPVKLQSLTHQSLPFNTEYSLGGLVNCLVVTSINEVPPPSKYYSHSPPKYQIEWEEEIPFTLIELSPPEDEDKHASFRFEICKLIEEEKKTSILVAWSSGVQIWDLNPEVIKRIPEFEAKGLEYINTLAYYSGTLVTSHANSTLTVRNTRALTSKTQTIKLNNDIHGTVQAEVLFLDSSFLYIGDTAGLLYFCRRDNGRLVTVMQSCPDSQNGPLNNAQNNAVNAASLAEGNVSEHHQQIPAIGEEEVRSVISAEIEEEAGEAKPRGNYHPLSVLPRNISFIQRIGRWVFVGTRSSYLFVLDIKSAADSASQDPRARKEMKWEPYLSYRFPFHAQMEMCVSLEDSLLLHFTRSIPLNPEDPTSKRIQVSHFVKWSPLLTGLHQPARVATTPFLGTISHVSEMIWNIIADATIAHNEDLGEFLSIVELIFGVVNNEKLDFATSEEGAGLLEELSKLLDEYLSTLTKHQQNGTLMKYLVHNRLRRRMVQLNSRIHITVQNIKKAYKLIEIFNVAPIRFEQRRREFRDRNGAVNVQEPFAINNGEEEEGDSEVTGNGDEGQLEDAGSFHAKREETMFVSIFGSKPMVEWDIFVPWLNTKLEKDMTDADLLVMKHILDNTGTGFVSRVQFGYFLKGFGPIDNCIENVHEVLSQGWFQGFLSSSEARLLLQRETPGTFLIRFSSSKPGSFAIAFKSKSSVHHILIHSAVKYQNKREVYHFALYEEATGKMKQFDSVGSIVSHYCNVLTTPYSSTLPKARWFQGDLTGEEASDLLKGNSSGTYLIRFNSSGQLAASYVDPDGFTKHTVITQDPKKTGCYGILLQSGEHMWFKDMNELVAHCYQIGIFANPIKNVSSIFVSDRPARRIGRQAQNNHFESTSAEALIAVSNSPFSQTDYRGMTYLSIFTEK